jgi:hypothetical protein
MKKVNELLKKCLSFSTTAGNAPEPVATLEVGLNTHALMLSKSREEAVSHWKYVKGVLVNSGASVDTIEVAGFHYISAFEHGYGHGAEDQATGRIKFEHKL